MVHSNGNKQLRGFCVNSIFFINCPCGYKWRGATMTHKTLIWKIHRKKCDKLPKKMANIQGADIVQHRDWKSQVGKGGPAYLTKDGKYEDPNK